VNRARATFTVGLIVLAGLLALGAWEAPGLWRAGGVTIRRPLDLTRAGLTRLVVQEPVDTVLVLELAFEVPRAEWHGLEGLTIDYGLIVRDAGGAVITTRRGGALDTRGPDGGDVEVFGWLASFRVTHGAEYDVALDVLRPLTAPRAAAAELRIQPTGRTEFQRAGTWLLVALWLGALAVVGLALRRQWPALRAPLT
jgi:hypothetical protein